ncbi:MAG: insulinase family protein [Burkholderiales bacterium]|nr:insulinase family protein [Burkholderiales bacterium]
MQVVTVQPARAAPPIQHWKTGSGAEVLFVESRQLPMLDVSVDFPGGSARDTLATSGLASLTLRMLRMGSRAEADAPALSEDEISLGLADVGAQLSTTFDVDRAGYSLRTLSSARELERALEILAAVVQRPAFQPDVLAREKQRVIAGLREADIKPEVIAARAFARLVYDDHPYGLRAGGEVGAVARLSAGQLDEFHRRHYTAAHAVISIIGDVDRAQAQEIAERLAHGLPPASGIDPLPAVRPLESPLQQEVGHEAAQAHVLLGAPGLRRSDPDYFALWVGNYILGGGGFNSRLMTQVRERRGLTYHVYSSFSPYQQQGAFTIGLQTRKDQADEALRVVRDTLAEFVRDGPSESELESAKQNIIGGFPLRIDSNRKILDYLAVIGFYHLPLDYLDVFPQRVAELTAADIRDAFWRRIDPARMVTVVVGGVPAVAASQGR